MTDEERKARTAAYTRNWRARNPEKMQAARDAWAAKNPGSANERCRRWYAKNREKVCERNREARKRNPEKTKEANRNNRPAKERYYTANREKCIAATVKCRRKRRALIRSMNEAASFMQTLTQLKAVSVALNEITKH